MKFRAVVLAAGESKRMGKQKLLVPYRGRVLIEYVLDAARQWNPLVIAGPQVADYLAQRRGVEFVVNRNSQRGMMHSLALADQAVARDTALIVLLADKPLVTARLIERICIALHRADVVFPRNPNTQEPGHPVVFSPRARERIALLPDGDSLRTLRDDPALTRREIALDDAGAYVDIDTADAFTE